MLRFLQRIWIRLQLAWVCCLLSILTGMVPVAWLCWTQGRQLLEKGTVKVTALEAACYDIPFHFRTRTNVNEHVLLVETTSNDSDRFTSAGRDRIDRRWLTTALREIEKMQPRLVFLDWILSSGSSANPEDSELAEQLCRMRQFIVLASGIRAGQHEEPVPLFSHCVSAVGGANVDWDPWHTVRLVPGVFANSGSGTSAAWIVAERLQAHATHGESAHTLRWLNYERPEVFERISLSELIDASSNKVDWSSRFGGRAVFVGDQGEQLRSPIDGRGIPGVEVQATAVLNLWEQSFLRLASLPGQVLFILAWGTGLGLTLSSRHSVHRQMGVLLATVALAVGSIIVQLTCQVWWWWLIPVAFQTPVALLSSSVSIRPIAFISYCNSDGKDIATVLHQGLRARGHRAFLAIAPESIPAGAAFPARILRQVRHAPVFLLVLTPDSRKALSHPESWVCREVAQALAPRRLPLWPPKLILVLRVRTAPLNRGELGRPIAEIADLEDIEFDSGNRCDQVLDQICAF